MEGPPPNAGMTSCSKCKTYLEPERTVLRATWEFAGGRSRNVFCGMCAEGLATWLNFPLAQGAIQPRKQVSRRY